MKKKERKTKKELKRKTTLRDLEPRKAKDVTGGLDPINERKLR